MAAGRASGRARRRRRWQAASSRVLIRLPLWPSARLADRGGPERGLGVLPGRGAGGRVPAVPDRDVAAQRGQRGLVEDLGDQAHVLVDHDPVAVADRDAGRLLAAVLQCVQAEVGELGDVLTRGPDAEDPAGVPRGRSPGSRSSVRRPSGLTTGSV